MSMIAFYTGAAAMRAFQSGMDVTGHNLANVQTNGYKYRRAVFQDLLYSRLNTNVEGENLTGHGVKQEHIDQIMTPTALDQTMNDLDFALTGDGFFAVENRGQIEYTRNGAFSLSVAGDTVSLVTNDGAFVLDADGNRITLVPEADGTFDVSGLRERIAVYRFPNQWGLNPENNARYSISANSGQPVLTVPGDPNAANPVELLQGALEYSSVDMSTEIVNIITYQRAFQISSRVLQTADQMAEELNNLR